MTGARKLGSVSEAEYLRGEELSKTKSEYVGGTVYHMVGARNTHNIIAGNAFGILWTSLIGQECQPFNSDTKIRIRSMTETRFYYPDASVVCNTNKASEAFQDEPVVIVQVLSLRTRRIDESEKKDAYLSIPSLRLYLLVEQDQPTVIAWRKSASEFVREYYNGLDATIQLPEINACLLLKDLYRRIEFSPEELEE